MPHYKGPSAETLKALETVPNMYLVLDPTLHILTASNLYLQATETSRENIIGKHIFEAFPDNPDTPEISGVQNINSSLQEVLKTKAPHQMPITRYDVPDNAHEGNFIQKYWHPSHTPVLDDQGEIQYIIQLATDVTHKVVSDQALATSATKLTALNTQLDNANREVELTNKELISTVEALRLANLNLEQQVELRTAELANKIYELSSLNEELAAANEEQSVSNEELADTNQSLRAIQQQLEYETAEKQRAIERLNINEQNLRNMVKQAPVGMCIIKGRPLMLEEANDLFLEIVGKQREQFYNTPYWVVNREAAPFYEPITDNVLKTGETYHAYEHEIMLIRQGNPETVYVDFVYEPIKDTDGSVDAIMIVAIEVTEKVLARKVVEKTTAELTAINYELSTANEELVSSNEEIIAANEQLYATNDELLETRTQLQLSLNTVIESEARFRAMIHSSPVAMLVNRGEDLVFEEVNEAMLRLIGKDISVKGKPLLEALPELTGHPIIDVLYHTYHTGEKIQRFEEPVTLIKDGKPYNGYYNVNYNPLYEKGVITGIMQSAVDVTEQVIARKKVEQAEESLRIATESAELGTWYLHSVTQEFIISSRFKQIFGFNPDEDVSYDVLINQIHEDYQQYVKKAVTSSIQKGTPFKVEYPLTGYHDGKQRWVRSVGKLINDDAGSGSYITGVIAEITEQKQDEQRKNDFIGMVSHELKTPLTSLNAYLQMLRAKSVKEQDTFTAGALDKSVKQIKKMTTMINGFLNVSRLEAGKIHIDKQVFDMATLIKESEEETQLTITSHKLVYAPVERTIVNADRDKIGQVLNNFISNAVKYSPVGSTVNVACVTINGNALISVKDNGMGVASEDIDKLFDRYYRVEGNQSKNISGFGIGLYLCAEIIERHGGKIGVESNPGEGSNFWFTLPTEM